MATNCPICNGPLREGVAACPACGYRMLGSTQSFKPIRFGDQPNPNEEAARRKYDLRVVRGPQTGIDIELREGKLTIGRDPQCNIFLNDMTVSRMHAVIEVKPDGCVIRDKNSFNGVWVNDRMVDICSLKPGDYIQIGAFCLLYRERP